MESANDSDLIDVESANDNELIDVAPASEAGAEFSSPALPFSYARRHGVIVGATDENGVAKVSVRRGSSPTILTEVRRTIDAQLDVEIIDADAFEELLQATYESKGNQAKQMVEGLEDDTDLLQVAQDLPEPSDLLEAEDDAPIIRLINAILTSAIKENASDIHIEPYENRLVVRFRIDGVMQEVLQSRRAVAPLVVSRVKVMSKLDIAEKRLPQDGRISLRIAGRAVDVRVSTMPSSHGERVVLRLLDKQAGRISLDGLGMQPQTQKIVDRLIHRPHGIILVTGPTGSGKTTTLLRGTRAYQ